MVVGSNVVKVCDGCWAKREKKLDDKNPIAKTAKCINYKHTVAVGLEVKGGGFLIFFFLSLCHCLECGRRLLHAERLIISIGLYCSLVETSFLL